MSRLNYLELKKKVEEDRAAKNLLKSQYNDMLNKIEHLEQAFVDTEKARIVFQTIAQITLQKLEYHISNLATLALKSVNPDFPELVATITIRRNQTELDLLFKEHDKEQKPMESAGFGAVNILCYALRITFWSLNKTRNVMILDEPTRDLSPDLQHKASEMFNMIIDKYKIQHIIVSHADNLNYAADKTFLVAKENKISKIEIT